MAKLNSSGSFIWTKTITDNYDVAYDVGVDAAGNVYATGYFEGNADFDPGPGGRNASKFDTHTLSLWRCNEHETTQEPAHSITRQYQAADSY